jgi:hypothetical protein
LSIPSPLGVYFALRGSIPTASSAAKENKENKKK